MNTRFWRHRWFRFGAPVLVAVTGLGAMQLTAAAPASAATGLMKISMTSASNSTATKTVRVTCPEGKTAVGAAASVSRPSSVHITALWPSGRTALVRASETRGTDASWTLTASATCVTRPAGLQYLQGTSEPISDRYVGAGAECPAGKELIGFGGMVTGGRVNALVPSSPNSTTALSVKTVGTTLLGSAAADIGVRTIAVCANAGHGTEVVESAPVEGTSGSLEMEDFCPAGKMVHAAGGWAPEPDTGWISGLTFANDLRSARISTRNTVSERWRTKVFILCGRSTS